LRIAIDARKLHDYGIGTYVRNLVYWLARLDFDDRYVLLCRPRDVEYVRSLGTRFEPWLAARHYSIGEQISILLALSRARVDLFHALTTSCLR
jgi:hypothetical protein